MKGDRLWNEIVQGLALAKAKGCPVESIWLTPDARDALAELNGPAAITKIQGHHVSIIRNASYPWSFNLECGWTNDKGQECYVIIPSDIQENVFPKATSAIDTAPMEAHPLWASFG